MSRRSPRNEVLPVINGVGPSVIVLPETPAPHWHTLLDFLDERFPNVPREDIAARIDRGDVRDADGNSLSVDHAYTPRQKLFYYRQIDDEPRVPFEETILFEDELIVAVDKPHFLSMTPGGRFLQETLLVRLRNKLQLDSLAPMHRLDRETAGVVLFTKQPDTRGRYQHQFTERRVEKLYHAVAAFRADLTFPLVRRSHITTSEHFMRMREAAPSEGLEPNAETEIDVIDTQGDFARYALRPRTGRKHQLRVHMLALGMPILNDQIYPVHAAANEEDMMRPLQLLAKSIAFRDPITGQARVFESQRVLSLQGSAIDIA